MENQATIPNPLPSVSAALEAKAKRTGMGLRAFCRAAKTSASYVIIRRNTNTWPVTIKVYDRWIKILFSDE